MPTDEEDRPRRRRADEEEYDDADDVSSAPRPRPRRSNGADGFATLVPFRNGPALAAYYCGVFGLIPGLGFILGPIAFILGIVGLIKKKKDPRVHGTGHAFAGIILGIIDPALWIVLWYFVFDGLTK